MSFPLPDHIKQIPNVEFNHLMDQVVQLQNGALSKQMQAQGLQYGLNYGVQIPLLKNLASKAKPNNALAYLLWNQNIRESKLLATWLFVPHELDSEKVVNLIKTINNIELAEQMARNCLYQIPNLSEFIVQMPNRELYPNISVILAVARAIELKNLAVENITETVESIILAVEGLNFTHLKQPLVTLYQKAHNSSDSNKEAINRIIKASLESENNIIVEAAQHFFWLNQS